MSDSPIDRVVPIDTIEPERFDQLSRRAQLVVELITNPVRCRQDIERAADLVGVHPSTIYRDLQRADGAETVTVRSLVESKPGFPKGRSRIHPSVERIIEDCLRDFYFRYSKRSLLGIMDRIEQACEEAGQASPSRATIIRRRNKVKRTLQERSRNGRKAAEAVTPHHGRFNVDEPRAVYQIDHTLADVIVVDSVHRKPIGRPWLTLVIDVATRMVAGYYVSLEPPSLLRAAVAIEFAVRPKKAWLMAGAYSYPWPVDGLPRLVHSDRAREFRAKNFERALRNQGVDTFLRPAGRPHWGGHIERLIGTVMGACRMLPGATHSSPSARGDYDSVKAARLDLDQLEDWVAHQILGVYHNTVHSSLGCTPLEAWDRASKGLGRRLPDNLEVFKLDLMPSLTRRVSQSGLRAFGQDYACHELKLAYASGVTDIEVRFDPRDLSKLWARLEPDRYTVIPYRFESDPRRQPSLALHRAVTYAARKEGRPPRQGMLARHAAAQIEAQLAEEAPRSVRARRQQERLSRARRATGAGIDDDDSWGGAF